ncbi:MAG: hypothetical protein J6D09_00725 [Clostridia bacterium]|nr:hypothetical protein [Clostridia bacterium]
MKRIAVLLLFAFLLSSCRSGDLMTIYSEGETSEAITTEAETEPVELPVGSLKLLALTPNVPAGKNALVTVRGLPNTEYSITVTYSTSESVAQGLEAKYSDKDGKVTWEWRVGNQTKSGTYTIEIKSKTEKITVYFNVTAPEGTK